MPDAKKSAAVQATDEWPIAPLYLRQIYVIAHLAFLHRAKNIDSHWVLNPGCMVDVRDVNETRESRSFFSVPGKGIS